MPDKELVLVFLIFFICALLGGLFGGALVYYTTPKCAPELQYQSEMF